jgi:sigma-B regulation protein RsbU (phosphoserine phosphatase)
MPPVGAGATFAATATAVEPHGPTEPATLAPPPASAPVSAPPFAPAVIEKQVESVAREVAELRDELEAIRRRDEALHTYLRKMDDELRLAARLQQDFLPKTLPQVGRVRFHTLFRPAGYVSGDLYDVMRLDERRCGFYMADAVGHGVPAALLTMFIKHALQTKEIDPHGKGYRLLEPGEALRRLNERLIDQNLSHSTFATALYGTIDVETLDVTISRAGHPHPIVLQADGWSEALIAEGSLLGIFPEETYTSFSTRLRAGDRLVVYTDGLDVAFQEDPSSESGLGSPRWQDELGRRRSLPTQQLLEEFAGVLDAEAGSIRPKDDVTVVVVEAVA